MRTQSVDTDSKTEAVWIAMLRKAALARKFAQVRSLSEVAMSLSRRAIERRNPHLSQTELRVLFVRHFYGADLADRFGEYVKNRTHEEA